MRNQSVDHDIVVMCEHGWAKGVLSCCRAIFYGSSCRRAVGRAEPEVARHAMVALELPDLMGLFGSFLEGPGNVVHCSTRWALTTTADTPTTAAAVHVAATLTMPPVTLQQWSVTGGHSQEAAAWRVPAKDEQDEAA